jgi:biotin--protein ligase
MGKIVRVYDDDGVSQTCLPHVLHMFRSHFVSPIDGKNLIGGHWMADTAVLCIPGGAADPYGKKLNGTGNRHIGDFVKNGGSYFGICAGAYYGASRTEFDGGGPMEIICENELKFFDTIAVGPAFGKFDYKTYRHMSFSQNAINFPDGVKFANLMFHGGPYFANVGRCHGVNVLAKYRETDMPSIIYGKYGDGTVVLCGPHLCIDETIFTAKTNRHFLAIGGALAATSATRLDLIATIFQIIGL